MFSLLVLRKKEIQVNEIQQKIFQSNKKTKVTKDQMTTAQKTSLHKAAYYVTYQTNA